jgi:uncharacterized protein YqgQ
MIFFLNFKFLGCINLFLIIETNKNDDIVKQLEDLKKLYDSGALTEEEYKKAKTNTFDTLTPQPSKVR